jgi:hypothetical protein
MGRKLRLNQTELSRIYRKFLKNDEKFNSYYEITRKNTDKRVWIIGSYVYRNLIREIYGIPLREKSDFDFLLETPFLKFDKPEGWDQGQTRYGDLRIWKGDEKIDFNSLNAIRSIIRRRVANPTIDDFLQGTPFNLDSIAYDTQSRLIVGAEGIEALKQRILEINDYDSLKESKPKGINTKEFMKKKAAEIRFRVRIDPGMRSIITLDELVSPFYEKDNSQLA